jgi:ubiquinone/menaquinone biosynthesis C-methylase UbiE
MESPERDEWQKPVAVLEALHIQPGQVACDIGAGPGYFALRLGREVGADGAVFATDVEPRILEVLRNRIQKSGLVNVVPILGLPGEPLIPLKSCDLILVVDTFHHFSNGASYLRRLARSLRKGGRLVNIDFHKRELPVGPPLEHKVSREEFLSKAQSAGLVLEAEHQFLPYQYFLVFLRS